jgi:hypothetical protein
MHTKVSEPTLKLKGLTLVSGGSTKFFVLPNASGSFALSLFLRSNYLVHFANI